MPAANRQDGLGFNDSCAPDPTYTRDPRTATRYRSGPICPAMQSLVERCRDDAEKSGRLPKQDAALACPEDPEIKHALGQIDEERAIHEMPDLRF